MRIEWVSLNRRDLLLVEGVYNPRQTLPVVPCSDGAGTVEAVGPGCARVRPGDRVVISFCPSSIAGEPDITKAPSGPHPTRRCSRPEFAICPRMLQECAFKPARSR